MFITKKKHNKIVKEGQELHLKIVSELKQELKEAKDLKLILEKFYPIYTSDIFHITNGGGYELNLPDDVLRYTEDILGGKVIKQEGNKCLVIDKEGGVKTGLTKQKPDKGFSYKLIRK